jgi:hypothetical protein
MKPKAVLVTVLVSACLLITGPVKPAARAQDSESCPLPPPRGVHLELTRDFYEALRNEGGGSSTTYSNDPSAQHLKEIAVSSRFMVQTNLEIIRQQEEIIDLLRRVLEKK